MRKKLRGSNISNSIYLNPGQNWLEKVMQTEEIAYSRRHECLFYPDDLVVVARNRKVRKYYHGFDSDSRIDGAKI